MVHSCLTLCDPMDCSLPGSSVLGILQTRILGWVASSFSRDQNFFSCVSCIVGRFFTTVPPGKPWDTIHRPFIANLFIALTNSVLHVRACFSHVQLYATPWTVAHQAPLSMGFSRQEYWGGLHALLQRIFATQGLNLRLLHVLQVDPQ